MRSVLGIVCSLFLLGVAFGQTDRGTITGTISDPAGAVVANAPIQAKNTETGATYQAASTATGNYTLAQLPAGPYEITVTVPGFKTFLRRNLQVQVAQTLRVDMKLEVGTAAESVTVSAESSLLKTESGDVSHNVSSDRLNSLPILQIGAAGSGSQGVRNPMAVTNLAPGTYWQPNFQVRVNGAPSNSEQIRIEGQDATNGVVSFAQAETQPSVDAIQELSIQTSNYAAEFGQAGSGVFNFTMKSGTNQYHGTAYEYLVNEALNSGLAYQNVRPKQRRSDFGGTFGGPIWIPKVYDGHDRSFFFFNYEQFRENISISDYRTTVPTAAYRAGDFTTVLTGRPLTGAAATDALGRPLSEGMIFDPLTEALAPNGKRVRDQFPSNQIPVTRFDPVSKKILALVPNPTDTSRLFQNGIYPFNSLRVSPIPALKLDHSFTSASKLSFYWSTSETAVQECRPLCGSTGFPNPISQTRGTFIESYTMRMNFDHTLTPTLLLHLGAGILSNDFKDTSPTTDYNAETELGLRGATFNSRFPQFLGMTGASNTGGLDQLGPGAQSRSREAKPTFNASLAWVKDNHTFKFGADLVIDGHPTAAYTSTAGTYNFSADQTSNTSVEGLSLGGRFLGFPFASFVLGAADNVTIAAVANSRGGRQFWGFYAQDTWKVTRKLTVDYGLRWDYFTYPREQYGRSPDFSATTPNPSAGGHLGATIFEATCNCRFAKNYPFAFGPRLGLAYQIDPKTVLRAGIGLSYSQTQGGSQGAAGASVNVSSTNYGDPGVVLATGIPVKPTWPNLVPGLFPVPGSIGSGNSGAPPAVDQNYGRPARQIQWSIGVQREIFPNLVAEVSYVANRGAWWNNGNLVDYNALSPGLLASYGLDVTNAADRATLISQVGSAGAGAFRNHLPYTGFPTTQSVAQSLRPYPQFGTIPVVGAALGRTWYDSLQAKVTKRFSYGLDFTYTFTWQKELSMGADSDFGGGQVNDVLNRDINKYISGFSRPIIHVLALNYRLPAWGSNRVVSTLVRDWTIGASMQYTSGLPFRVPNSTSNLNQTLLRSTWAERVPGQPLFLQDINCHCFDPTRELVLNPAAWTEPAPGTFSPSTAYYNDYRQQRRPNESLSIGRIFRFTERLNLQIRAEFTNPFNRLYLNNPSSTSYAAATGVNSDGSLRSGFGFINTGSQPPSPGPRQGTIVARIQF